MHYRSSHQRCSVKKIFLEISQNSQESTCGSLFFNKVAGLRPATLLKKRLWHKCFPVCFTTFLRTLLSQNTSWRLLLRAKLKKFVVQDLISRIRKKSYLQVMVTRCITKCFRLWNTSFVEVENSKTEAVYDAKHSEFVFSSMFDRSDHIHFNIGNS